MCITNIVTWWWMLPLTSSKSCPAWPFCNLHTLVLGKSRSCELFEFCWRCLHVILLPCFQRWRRRRPMTHWCWQESKIEMKNCQFAPRCSFCFCTSSLHLHLCTLIKKNLHECSSNHKIHKLYCIPVFSIWNSNNDKQRHVNNKPEIISCLFSFFWVISHFSNCRPQARCL